jgi:hypothetical protein
MTHDQGPVPMSDDQPEKRSMNDISHLFLSNVRDLHGNGGPRPQRTAPATQTAAAKPMTPAELTSDEIAHVVGRPGVPTADDARGSDDERAWAQPGPADTAPVTAVLASHLNGRQLDRVREYARHVAASAGRVGLIDLDVNDFRLTCFDSAGEPGAADQVRPTEITGAVDPREIAAAVEELNLDVDRWVVLVPNLRTPEAATLIADAEHWALLCTPDHDGVVAGYRTLKGVAEARSAGGGPRPATRLTVAVLDAAGDAEAARVQQKLAGVSRQFLGWDADAEPPVRYAAGVAEHPLMHCRVSGGRGQGVVGPHWAAVAELLGRPRRGAGQPAGGLGTSSAAKPEPLLVADAAPRVRAATDEAVGVRRVGGADASAERARTGREARDTTARFAPAASLDESSDAISPSPTHMRIEPAADAASSPAPALTQGFAATPGPTFPFAAATAPATASFPMTFADAPPAGDDVLDLPGDVADPRGVLSAVLRRPEWGLAECPIEPPACPAAARLAVSRDRGLVLVAVAARGLADLRAIGQAYRWLAENRGLIALALPQFAIDAGRTPGLHLLVDQGDIAGDQLRPIMQAEHVRVRAYRTLRWAGRTGLLLDAA